MIYFIFIVLYSENHYKIISSGDSRYTKQRFIIYDSEDKLKEKCIHIALQEKTSASKVSVWKNYDHIIELFDEIYAKIYKYPIIQQLKNTRLDYNKLLESKLATIQKTLEWNTFRPQLTPEYNYSNTTSVEDLDVLVQELKTTRTNIKKYKLLSNISEESRKLSLQYISLINNFIIQNKDITSLNFLTYQSSCCDFQIQESYQETLSEELTSILNYVAILYKNIHHSTSDYYLLNNFKGINDRTKGRHLLDYLNIKNVLHEDYANRIDDEDYHITDKDTTYRQYLKDKIYKINHFVITDIFDDENVGYKRIFIDSIDNDYNLLTELDNTDELRSALKLKLEEKYRQIIRDFNITDDKIYLDSFNAFIETKLDIIIDHNGETRKDLVSKKYIYEIDHIIDLYIQDKNIEELKKIVDHLEYFIEQNIKIKLNINSSDSQQVKIFRDNRYKREYKNEQLSTIKNINTLLMKIDGESSIFEDILKIYSVDDDDDDDDILENYKDKTSDLIGYIVNMYNTFEQINIHKYININKFKLLYNSYEDLLLETLGFNDGMKDEKYDNIENDLIVQGYVKNSVKYNNELEYRQRHIENNLKSDRILIFKECTKYVLNVYNKLIHYRSKNLIIKEDNLNDEENIIKDIFNYKEDVYFNIEYIDTNLEDIYKILDIVVSKRDRYNIYNKVQIKSLCNINIMFTLVKYIFIKVLYLVMNIGLSHPGVIENKCVKLKQVLLLNIIRIHIQLKNTDETISDKIRDYTDDLNKKRKEKFESMVKDNPSKAAIYLICRTINMGDVFSKRDEDEQKQIDIIQESLSTVHEEGGMAAFVSQAGIEGIEELATSEGMAQYEQHQADMDAAQEFGMDNVPGEDDY